jgi:hypothetical protein
LPDGRDVVIYPRGASFGFLLPSQHTVTVDENDRTVYLSVPDHGSAFVPERIDEAPGEVRIYVGVPSGGRSRSNAVG